MHRWLKRILVVAAPLLLTGCLWGPGKFTSQLTLRKDGSFVLDYRGEMVLQIPKDAAPPIAWKDSDARCYEGRSGFGPTIVIVEVDKKPTVSKPRPCSQAEIASQRSEFEKNQAEMVERNRKQAEQAAVMFGLPGLDDASNRAFAAKVMKYAGWRSVTYRGNGVYDVDYHFAGRATQDFVFPALPDNDLLKPFIAVRRRADGSVLVTAPAFTGGAGPLMERMAAAGAAGNAKTSMVSHAQGRLTVITDGEILTNNSEDGPSASPAGQELHWDVNAESKKIPETLIRL